MGFSRLSRSVGDRRWIGRLAFSLRGPSCKASGRVSGAAADGSILVVRIFCRLMNSDAFFAFSDMRVRFVQVGPQSPARPSFAGRWRGVSKRMGGLRVYP
ncbi:hypothetical protein FLK63_09110 [Burkholderia gladioli]|nr:hypothetical protein [Burkholderia gladioli]